MQLRPQLHQLTLPFTVPTPGGPLPRSVSLWLLTGPRIVGIDAGVAGAEVAIGALLGQLGRSAGELDWLLLTHSHPDHIGGAAAVVAASGCRVAAHAAERGWIEDPALQARERPVPGFDQLVHGKVQLARELRDGEILRFDGLPALTVLHTPGHSNGSVSLWAADEGWLVSGDAVPVPGDLPIFDDFAAAERSLDMIRARAPTLLLSSWQAPAEGEEVGRRLDAAVAWLRQVRDLALAWGPRVSGDTDPLALCRQVVPRLGLPLGAVNPLVARSLAACLRAAGPHP
ncbi:MAG TPA: MBL fold metallo-hydrolase [Anaeromyxobacteraceae bacterium]|nr:MBL fold metallo-hydrolase [Anaeromyxobacteraceae bacterium]